MSDNNFLASRIKELMDEKPISQSELARICGVEQPSVAKWLNGKTKSLKATTASKLAKHFGVNVDWVAEGKGPKKPRPVDRNVIPVPMGMKLIPLVSNIPASPSAPMGDMGPDDYISGDDSYSDGTFAMKISGDSMTPEFNTGDIVIIDPTITPRPGDYVAALTDFDTEHTFKKYVVRRRLPNGHPIFDLVPLNPDYPVISNEDEPINIAGVCIEHRKFRKRFW